MRFQRIAPGLYPLFTYTMRRFWQQHGAIIYTQLRLETAVSFDEIVTAYSEYLFENPEHGIEVDERYVAWVLLKLAEYKLIQVITDDNHPTLLVGHRPQYHIA